MPIESVMLSNYLILFHSKELQYPTFNNEWFIHRENQYKNTELELYLG